MSEGATQPPVIPEAEPQARLSGTSGNESDPTRSRSGASLAFGSHRSVRDDGWWRRLLDSDLFYSFTRSKLAMAAALVTVLIVGAALLAPWIAPQDPYDLKTLSLLDANTPPAWENGGDSRFLLGTDDQGRDILSTILYGTRSSLTIGVAAVLLATVLGVALGLWAG